MMEEVMPSEELSKEYVRGVTAHKGIQVICSSKPKTCKQSGGSPKSSRGGEHPQNSSCFCGDGPH